MSAGTIILQVLLHLRKNLHMFLPVLDQSLVMKHKDQDLRSVNGESLSSLMDIPLGSVNSSSFMEKEYPLVY